MNVPPTDGVRVAVSDLEELVVAIFKAVPIPENDARLIAGKLVECDLRGVVSHGVLQVNRYVRSFQDGSVNPSPRIRVLQEGPATAALTGDGGLGYLVAVRAMEMAIVRARDLGIGAVTSTYHGHLGSAGIYSRMAMRQDLIASARQPGMTEGVAPPHHRRDDRAAVLEAEIDVATGRLLPAADLRQNPDVPQQFIALKKGADVVRQLRNRYRIHNQELYHTRSSMMFRTASRVHARLLCVK